jgi:hypothetical protein
MEAKPPRRQCFCQATALFGRLSAHLPCSSSARA